MYSQEKPDTSARTAINFKVLPVIRLVFADGSYKCGYYDASNNILYNCYGIILLNKPTDIRDKISDNLCCRSEDFDGDGVTDGEDRCIWEWGPVNNFGCPVVVPEANVHYPGMPNVYFTTSSSWLSPASKKRLNTTVKILKEYPYLYVNLDGHSDKLGSEELNRSLCMARIKAVRSYLLSAGINKNRITDTVHGATHPIENPETKAGQAYNRRVELYLYKKSDK